MNRQSIVAGKFYPDDSEELKLFLEKNVDIKNPCDVIAVVMPHAGYVYSGYTAAKTIGRVRVPKRVLLLGPNHTGYGSEFSVWDKGYWHIPLGKVPVDSPFTASLLKNSSFFSVSYDAHLYEHSLEVQLPFLYYLNDDIEIVPITVKTIYLDRAKSAALELASLIDSDTLIVASTDMTHYEPLEIAEKNDKMAIESVLKLDEDMLADIVISNNISMCGFVPVFMALVAAKKRGAAKGELVDYRTSGDVTGDYGSVVGYAGIVIL